MKDPEDVHQPTRHWDDVYARTPEEAVSWYEDSPATSLRLVAGAAAPGAAVIDVGAGASRLVDGLLDRGWQDVTVLDVSETALTATRARLEQSGKAAHLVVADLLTWRPERTYDVWHDRAVFHFLVDQDERQRYVQTAAAALRSGGALVIGTFAEDGPTSCSGLPTARYDATGLAAVFHEAFVPERTEREEHTTPRGVVQPFTWVVLRRV